MRFKKYISESGQAAGTHEILKTSLKEARDFIETKRSSQWKRFFVDKEIPDFDQNYKKAMFFFQLNRPICKKYSSLVLHN